MDSRSSINDKYVVFSFSDGTKQTIHTTFNNEDLQMFGVSLKSDALWDIDKEQYIHLRDDAVDVAVYDEKPVFSNEVLVYASRFI